MVYYKNYGMVKENNMNKMKGVILAGGSGSRLGIISRVNNKHTNLVYKYPMIVYPLMNMKECGIEDIQIVTNVSNGLQLLLKDGSEFGVNITYRIQAKPAGIADALRCAEHFTNGKKFMCMLGDNFYRPMPVPIIKKWKDSGKGSGVFIKRTDTPEKYGIWSPQTNSIVEKPQTFISEMFVMGLYLYDSKVWGYIKEIHPSKRNEYEITDINNIYLDDNDMDIYIYPGDFLDCGDCDSLLETSIYVKDHCNEYDHMIERYINENCIRT